MSCKTPVQFNVSSSTLICDLSSKESIPGMKMTQGRRKDILSVNLNQEHDAFTVSMESGVRIFNADPLAVKGSIDSSDIGSIAIAEMLHRTNLVAIVAGGSKPKFAENAVLIYDDVSAQVVLEFTVSSAVLAVKMRRDRLYIVEKNHIHGFVSPFYPNKLFTIKTRDNPKGICDVTPFTSSDRQLMVFPGHKTGSIQIVDLTTLEPGMSSSPSNINAHQSEIACISLNHDGTLIASASSTGTLIRVFDSLKKTLLVELRRGTDPASLYCINFSQNSEYLCASSDKGTVHIFALKETHLNKRSTFSRMGSFLGQYIESQWALTNFTVQAECACRCAFGPKSSVYAMCFDGTFHKYIFNPDGIMRDSFIDFLDLTEEEDIF